MLSAVLVLLLAEFGLSVRIPVAGRVRPSAFHRRRSTVVALSDLYDIAYFANVTLGEQTVPVLLDTSRCVFYSLLNMHTTDLHVKIAQTYGFLSRFRTVKASASTTR
jgi:hypothetical protein